MRVSGNVCIERRQKLNILHEIAKYAKEQGLMPKDMLLKTPETCAKELLKIIDGSTREKDGGKFLNSDGGIWDW